MRKLLLAVVLMVVLSGVAFGAPALKKGLGMTPTQFMNAFNAFTKTSQIPINIPTITLQKGEINDTFIHSFTENLALVGVMQKVDKRLLSLTMLGTPKNNDESTALLMIFGSIMATINPNISKENRGKLLMGLVMDSSGNMAEENSATRGTTRYLFKSDSIMGIQLYVTNANEE
jgi:hypothetical protein